MQKMKITQNSKKVKIIFGNLALPCRADILLENQEFTANQENSGKSSKY